MLFIVSHNLSEYIETYAGKRNLPPTFQEGCGDILSVPDHSQGIHKIMGLPHPPPISLCAMLGRKVPA